MAKKETGWTYVRREIEVTEQQKEIWRLEDENDRLREAARETASIEDEVWLQDGRIFYSHLCNGVRLEQEISKGWRITSAGEMFPSFACVGCGAHFHATVIVQMRRAGFISPFFTTKKWRSKGFGGYSYGWEPTEGKTKPNSERSKDGTYRNADGDLPRTDGGLQLERHPGGAGGREDRVRGADEDWELPGFSCADEGGEVA